MERDRNANDRTYCFRRRVKISAVWRRKVNTRAIIVIVLAMGKVNISIKQTEEISRAGVTIVKLDQDFLVKMTED